MESGAPEFVVERATLIGSEATFTTPVLGYHGIFRYNLKDVKAMAPEGANAFLMGEATLFDHDTKQTAQIQFFDVQVNPSRRILRKDEIRGNIGLIKKLLGK